MENRLYSQTPESPLAADNSVAKQYISAAGSLLVPAIIGLALAATIPFAGEIAGIILACIVNSKISKLPAVNEATLDDVTLAEYQSAARKVKTAGILAKIALIVSIVFFAIYMFSFAIGFIGVLLSMM